MFKNGFYEKEAFHASRKSGCSWKRSSQEAAVRDHNTDWYNGVATPIIAAVGIPILRIWRATALLNGTDNHAQGAGDCTHYHCIGSAVQLWNEWLVGMIKPAPRLPAHFPTLQPESRWRRTKQAITSCQAWAQGQPEQL